jgi:hypothetical protein
VKSWVCDVVISKTKTASVLASIDCDRLGHLLGDFYSETPSKMQQCIKIFIIPYFKRSSTCFGRHTAHHQEPKTAQAASGFAYVEGYRTCSCWTLSGSV